MYLSIYNRYKTFNSYTFKFLLSDSGSSWQRQDILQLCDFSSKMYILGVKFIKP